MFSLFLFCATSLSFFLYFPLNIYNLYLFPIYISFYICAMFHRSTLSSNENLNHQSLFFSQPPPPPFLLSDFTLSSVPTWSRLLGACSRWPSQSNILTRSRTWASLRGSWAIRSLCRSRSHVVRHGGYDDASLAGWCAGPARDCCLSALWLWGTAEGTANYSNIHVTYCFSVVKLCTYTKKGHLIFLLSVHITDEIII